ncbi:MAG TPA: ParA family protein [Novimethylophilus sp.]|jgi:chromosome partitioning protein|uniref:ParA family protein n=1 Tax=Novimethylophilus sp. TaxID=2137426 RepID=UPI002F4075A9
MSVVAVFNQKGGVGKTTTSLNLLAALAQRGRFPLGIDLDPQSHLTLSCGIKSLPSSDTVYAFYSENKPLSQLMRELPSGAHIIPAHMELFKVDSLYGRNPNITSQLKRGLTQELLPDEMIPVVIDCSPMLGVLSLNAVFAAQRLLIPVSADYLSMQGVNRLDAALRVLEKPLGKRIDRRIVVTRFDSRRRLSYDIYDKLREHYGKDLCETRIAETVSLAESPVHGRDVFTFAPHGQGAKDYNALAEELIGSGFFNPA